MKPEAELIGADGNIFSLLGIARRALRKAGQVAEMEEMTQKVTSSSSYDEALNIIANYVEVV